MPNLSSYTKATEASILSSSPSADGEMAYSTDTNKLFLSDGTTWVEWRSDGFSRGSYSLDANTTISARPYRHIDMSDTTGMKNASGSAPSNGDTISEITCKSTGKKLTQDVSVYQPKFISSAGTSPITSHANADTDALINGKSVLQFKNSKTDGQTFIAEPGFGNGDNPSFLKQYSVFMVYRNAGGNNSYPSIIGTPITRSTNTGNYAFFALTDQSNVADGSNGYIRFSNHLLSGINAAYALLMPIGYRHLLYHTNSLSNTSHYAFTKDNNSSASSNDLSGKYLTTDIANPAPTIIAGLSIAHGYYGNSTTSWGGEMGEIIFFREVLSETDINAIGAYLSSKWGITYTDI